MIVSARSKNASMTSSFRSWHRYAGQSLPPGALVMHPSTAMSSRFRRCGRRASSAICLSVAKTPALIHSSWRPRIVLAEQSQSAIDSCEQPNRRT
jgi:hypothetical protein